MLRANANEKMTRAVLAIGRWHRKMAVREFYFFVRDTFVGKMALLAALVATPILIAASVENFSTPFSLNPVQLDGLLIAANLSLLLNYVILMPPLFAKEFLVKRRAEPLETHPFVLPALASRRLLSTILLGGSYLLAFHYLFYMRALYERLHRPWVGFAVHGIIWAAVLLVGGVAIGAVCRRWLTRPDVGRRAQLLFRFGGAAFFGSFCVTAVGINSVLEHAPEWFGFLGRIAPPSRLAFLVPLDAAISAGDGRWLLPMLWLGVIGIAAHVALRAMQSWAQVAHLELPLDLDAPTRRRYLSLFVPSRDRSTRWRALTTFWRKDILAPYARNPGLYLGQQWFVIWVQTGALVGVTVAVSRKMLQSEDASAVLVAASLVVAATLAMFRTLSSLGEEGSELAWLRPIVTGRALFFRKGLANLTYVLVHALVYALLLFGVAGALGVWHLGLALPLTLAAAASVTLSFAGSTLGFLLPDFRRRASFLPGASFTAKCLYAVNAAMVVGLVGFTHRQLAAGRADIATYAGFLTSFAIIQVPAFAGLAWWAVRRLERIEI